MVWQEGTEHEMPRRDPVYCHSQKSPVWVGGQDGVGGDNTTKDVFSSLIGDVSRLRPVHTWLIYECLHFSLLHSQDDKRVA